MKLPMVFLLGFPGHGLWGTSPHFNPGGGGLKKKMSTVRRFEKEDVHCQEGWKRRCQLSGGLKKKRPLSGGLKKKMSTVNPLDRNVVMCCISPRSDLSDSPGLLWVGRGEPASSLPMCSVRNISQGLRQLSGSSWKLTRPKEGDLSLDFPGLGNPSPTLMGQTLPGKGREGDSLKRRNGD